MKVIKVNHLSGRKDFIRYPEIFEMMKNHNLFVSREKQIKINNSRVSFSNSLLIRLGAEAHDNYLRLNPFIK